MKARKLTKVDQVKALLKDNPNIQTKDVAKALNIAYAYACTLVWKAKGGKKSKRLTPVNKSEVAYKATKGRKSDRKEDYHKYINGAHVLFSKNIDTLQAEVIKLNEWCVQWSARVKNVENLENELRSLTAQYADKCAIIEYLEKKLGV